MIKLETSGPISREDDIKADVIPKISPLLVSVHNCEVY